MLSLSIFFSWIWLIRLGVQLLGDFTDDIYIRMQRCWATPTEDSESDTSFELIDTGCGTDDATSQGKLFLSYKFLPFSQDSISPSTVTRHSVVSALQSSNSSSTPPSGFTAISKSVSVIPVNQSVPMMPPLAVEAERTDNVNDVVPIHHTDQRTGKKGTTTTTLTAFRPLTQKWTSKTWTFYLAILSQSVHWDAPARRSSKSKLLKRSKRSSKDSVDKSTIKALVVNLTFSAIDLAWLKSHVEALKPLQTHFW